MTKVVIILIILFSLSSCDCLRLVSGSVIDHQTNRPINLAHVRIVGSNNAAITDSLGHFSMRIIHSGLQCYCKPKEKIIISAPLYLTDTFLLRKSLFKLDVDSHLIKTLIDPKLDFMSHWIYYDLQETIKLKIIEHIPASVGCETDVSASISIGITTTGDTIRVLELCSTKKDFKKDDIVIVIPAKNPDFPISHPRIFTQGTYVPLRPTMYDTRVLKTTFGILQHNR